MVEVEVVRSGWIQDLIFIDEQELSLLKKREGKGSNQYLLADHFILYISKTIGLQIRPDLMIVSNVAILSSTTLQN